MSTELDTVPFPHSSTLFLPAITIAPRVCRDFVRSTLDSLGFGHLTDTGVLCTSELVTNVHRHAHGLVHLQFTATPTRVRISVYDGNSALPVLRQPTVDDPRGRGLQLVRELSDGWGFAGDRPGMMAKGVWFELDTTTAATN